MTSNILNAKWEEVKLVWDYDAMKPDIRELANDHAYNNERLKEKMQQEWKIMTANSLWDMYEKRAMELFGVPSKTEEAEFEVVYSELNS